MHAAIFSDAHLLGPDDPNQALLSSTLRELDTPRIYLLGDIFQFWCGDTTPFGELIDTLHALRARETRVYFAPGNHDFAALDRLPVVAQESFEVELGGRRFHLSHGDQADRSLGYRALRRALRTRPSRAAIARLRPQRLGEGLAGLGAVHGPNPALLEAQERWARILLAQVDVVVHGHSHVPGIHHHPEGTQVNLGDFVTHHTWLAVGDELELRRA